MIKLHQLIPRVAAGAFILNSGLGKRNVDAETAKSLHAMAAGTYDFLADWDPEQFVKTLSRAEIALGVVLLVPFVPTVVASAALTAFAGGLVGMYASTPGLTEPGSVRPTQQGVPLAKDVWLLGIGSGLLVESLTRGRV
jgi:hypothetical protein